MSLRPRAISLFTGAGGLDLGLEAAGFDTCACVEIDPDARATLRLNRPNWNVLTPGDIHAIKPRTLLREAGLRSKETDLLAGGPPCQPFSKSGYWARGDSMRLADPRSHTLQAYLDVVDAALPRVMLLENVRGLTYEGKDDGLRLLQDGLDDINARRKTRYRLSAIHLNAAWFGVPQLRERVFVIASRDGREFRPPKQTHGPELGLVPFATCWDAIGDLDDPNWLDSQPDLALKGKWGALLPSIPEGENYLWHTPQGGGVPLFGWRTRYWSFLLKLAKNRPSWTIQAGPGPATGPFHWRSRLLSIRELCRLQTFPDSYMIVGDRRSAHRQIGNAVPSALGEMLGIEIRRQLLDHDIENRSLTLAMRKKGDSPAKERVRRVPKIYEGLCGPHLPHPGKGLGPGATRREGTQD